MNGIYPEFYIISAERTNLSEHENAMTTMSLMNDLEEQGLAYKAVTGYYQGAKEVALLVVTENREAILCLMEAYNQDCVLHADKGRECSLVFADTLVSKYVGKWTEVDARAAQGQDNYTQSGSKYYITKRIA